MKALLFAVVLAAVLIGGWLFLIRHPDPVAPVIPDVHSTAVADEHAGRPAKSEERSLASTPEPTVAPTAPAEKAASVRELSAAELKALEIETPPGVIEGIVLRHDKPITTGGLVFHQIGDGFYTRLPEHPREQADAGIGSTVIDAEGKFRIANLPTGNYVLGLDLGHGIQNERTAAVTGKPSMRIVIVLGGSGLHGHVYDANGRLLPGAKVTITSASEPANSRISRTSRTTGLDGAYAITDLNAGDYWLDADLQASRGSGSLDVMQRIALAADEERAFDIGSPAPARTWTGTVKSTAGDHVHGGGRFHLTRRADKAYSEKPFGEDGAIHIELQPGEYAVQVSLNSDYERRIDVADLSIGSADVNRDIILAGSRVSGVVIDAATGQPLQHYIGLSIGLRIRDGTIGGPAGNVDENGNFAIEAVQPGTWLASGYPLRLVEGDHELTVRAEDVDIPLRLTVRTH